MVVAEIMSEEPFTVEVTESIGRVIRKLREADVRHLPVVEGGMLVGIVSDRDLRALMPSEVSEFERADLEELWARPVSALMSSDVVSVTPESDLGEIIDLMIERKIGAVPVVEADSLKLVGIVSYIDVLRAARDEL